MKASQIKIKITEGALTRYAHLYGNTEAQRERFLSLLDSFISLFGDGEAELLSVPGRSEISGNHTDHNRGCVLAGAIDRDVIAVASKNGTDKIRFFSVGYPTGEITLSACDCSESFEKYTTSALIAGTVKGFCLGGYEVGGFDIAMTSDVLPGSGISSSAAFEVMIGNALNHLFNGGRIDNVEIAKIAQYAENEYFGKPCGLMDQMACAVGGFVYIDFESPKAPVVEPIEFSLTGAGYSLCIVNTGGNHANLTPDYAAVPAEMKAVAKCFGRDVLRGLDEPDIIAKAKEIRSSVGDRAILRALHYVRENKRVEAAKSALLSSKLDDFFGIILESGRSSFEYLQNVYTTQNVEEQGLSLALAVTDGALSGKGGAYRVHGGGFAGTIQAFVKKGAMPDYTEAMDAVFGKGSAMPLNIRPLGAIKLF